MCASCCQPSLPRALCGKPLTQLAVRMKKVEEHTVYEMPDCLEWLGMALLSRAEEFKRRRRERIPKWFEYSSVHATCNIRHISVTLKLYMWHQTHERFIAVVFCVRGVEHFVFLLECMGMRAQGRKQPKYTDPPRFVRSSAGGGGTPPLQKVRLSTA